MKDYLRNPWFVAGLVLVALGWGPLLAIIALDAVGLWPDPDPNPVGPGMLFFLTALPALLLLGVGHARVHSARRRESRESRELPADAPLAVSIALGTHPAVRILAGLGGGFLILRGIAGLKAAEGRGAAAAIVLGAVAIWWGVAGRLPEWFRRS